MVVDLKILQNQSTNCRKSSAELCWVSETIEEPVKYFISSAFVKPCSRCFLPCTKQVNITQFKGNTSSAFSKL